MLKCNTDGVSRGTPGPSSYAFCIRNTFEDPVYAEAKMIGWKQNVEAKVIALLIAIRFYKSNNLKNYLIKWDSLGVLKIIKRT